MAEGLPAQGQGDQLGPACVLLGQFLKAARVRAGKTLLEVHPESSGYLSRIERGMATPTEAIIYDILDGIGGEAANDGNASGAIIQDYLDKLAQQKASHRQAKRQVSVPGSVDGESQPESELTEHNARDDLDPDLPASVSITLLSPLYLARKYTINKVRITNKCELLSHNWIIIQTEYVLELYNPFQTTHLIGLIEDIPCNLPGSSEIKLIAAKNCLVNITKATQLKTPGVRSLFYEVLPTHHGITSISFEIGREETLTLPECSLDFRAPDSEIGVVELGCSVIANTLLLQDERSRIRKITGLPKTKFVKKFVSPEQGATLKFEKFLPIID